MTAMVAPDPYLPADPLRYFTDRERILSMFEQFLLSNKPGRLRILAINGMSGTGKSFLIEYLSQRICPSAGWRTGVMIFAQANPDFRSILSGVEDALKGCVPRESLKQYRARRDQYMRLFDQYSPRITVHQGLEATDYSSISGITQSAQVNAELRRRELQLRAELSQAFVELAEESERPLCLFIDGYEHLAQSDSELEGWLWEEILIKLAKNSPQPVLVVTCGWEWPTNAAIKPFVQKETLGDFDNEHVRDYLHKQGLLPFETPITNMDVGLAQAELVNALYDLTGGNPLVLALAVAYMNELPEEERTVAQLREIQLAIDEKARVELLNERLLQRLPEPHRTLLERGPVLRYFDQATLNILLNAEIVNESVVGPLDDRTYERFLRYPFINRTSIAGETLSSQSTFHDLIRRVRLKALSDLHPETKERLHLIIAVYYRQVVEAEQAQLTTFATDVTEHKYADEYMEILEKEFRAQLEYLYHALFVKDLQSSAYDRWFRSAKRAISGWRRRQAAALLAVVGQAIMEGNPFLNESSYAYYPYLILCSRFLAQEFHWEEARMLLEEVAKICEQLGYLTGYAQCLNGIGFLFREEGKYVEALSFLERAVEVGEQAGDGVDAPLNNIGLVYQGLGKLNEALSYFERALALKEQAGGAKDIAQALNNIGAIYREQGKFVEALSYHERALMLSEQIGDLFTIATLLNNIGEVYRQQGKLAEALSNFERALVLTKEIGNAVGLAYVLNNIGLIYDQQGESVIALSYHEQALEMRERVGNPTEIADSLNNIGVNYVEQGKWEEALGYHERALALREQVGNPIDIVESLNNIGKIYVLQGKLEEALRHYGRILAMSEQINSPATIANVFNNIGHIYYTWEQWRKALSYFRSSLELLEQVGDTLEIAQSLHNIASVYWQQKRFGQAIKHSSDALTLYRSLGDGFESHVATELDALSTYYFESGEKVKAIDCFTKAEKIRKSLQKK